MRDIVWLRPEPVASLGRAHGYRNNQNAKPENVTRFAKSPPLFSLYLVHLLQSLVFSQGGPR